MRAHIDICGFVLRETGSVRSQVSCRCASTTAVLCGFHGTFSGRPVRTERRPAVPGRLSSWSSWPEDGRRRRWAHLTLKALVLTAAARTSLNHFKRQASGSIACATSCGPQTSHRNEDHTKNFDTDPTLREIFEWIPSNRPRHASERNK